MMNESQSIAPSESMSFLYKYRFALFVVMSILVAFILVLISMYIYNSSGASQLDLSRPGYKSVRAQAVNSDGDFQNYSSTGPINVTTINEFESLYTSESQKIKAVDAFGGDPLSPDALGIGGGSQ